MAYLFISVLALATAAGTPKDRSADQPDRRTSAVLPEPGERAEDLSERPTAEDILKALQRRRPVNEIIPPYSAATSDPKPEQRRLLPEGSAVVSRAGWLKVDGKWWTFVPDPSEGEAVTKLLPNTNVEVMVRTAGASPNPVRFVISGEVTVFEGENHLLVRLVRRASGTDAGPASREPAHATKQTVPDERAPEPRNPSDSVPSADAQDSYASAEDVVAMLQAQGPAEEMMPVVSPMPDDTPIESATVARSLIPEGAPLVQRSGRLLRRGDWWTFAFESDHPDHPEPPLKLLPSRTVEEMVRAADRGSGGLVFLVSGEATVFEGENYLLPRVAIQRVGMGNLRR